MSPLCKLGRLINASSESAAFLENLKAFIQPKTLHIVSNLAADFSEQKLLQIFEEIANRAEASKNFSKRKISDEQFLVSAHRLPNQANVSTQDLAAWNRSLSMQFYGDSQHQLIDM